MGSPEAAPPATALWQELDAPKAAPRRAAWLFSFVDLTGILVGFFVLVYSTQVIDLGAWHRLSGGFRAAFNPETAVIPVIPAGQANGVAVVAVQRDVLPYLDSLLRNRLKGDQVWDALAGREDKAADEMLYTVPAALWTLDRAAQQAAWQRLGAVTRAWKNDVAVRVSVGEPARLRDGARVAAIAAADLAGVGNKAVLGEVVGAKMDAIELVIKGN
ncbi:MAG: hypothetical protein GC129_03140 [Proteobacteria bacterium]|nr:hypothetical protein [Pseudomonadota bacterium]